MQQYACDFLSEVLALRLEVFLGGLDGAGDFPLGATKVFSGLLAGLLQDLTVLLERGLAVCLLLAIDFSASVAQRLLILPQLLLSRSEKLLGLLTGTGGGGLPLRQYLLEGLPEGRAQEKEEQENQDSGGQRLQEERHEQVFQLLENLLHSPVWK